MVNQTIKTAPDRPSASGMPITETSNLATPTQRFYCEGCQEYHEVESLLDAVREEAERMRVEEGKVDDADNL